MLELTDTRWSELSTHDGDAAWVPEWLERLEASILASGPFAMTWNDENVQMLLASLAAFKGYLPLAGTIENRRIRCPKCDEVVDMPMHSYNE